jgi:hypothetical protein
MMKRDACFRVLARHLTDEIVIPVYSSAFDWLELAPQALNFYSFGAMGIASSHGHLEKGELAPKFDYRKLDDPGLRVAFKAALQRA